MSDDPWDYELYVAGDYETSGKLPEYALQPWRFPKGDAWVTSLAWVWREGDQTKIDGGLDPSKMETARMIEFILDTGRILVGWNLVYDLSIMIALGFEKWAHQIRCFDGMLAWRHLEIEPEYEMTGPSKKSYSLKNAVREFIPAHADYEEGINYHGTDPAELARLHEYNIKDNIFALKISAMLYRKMKPKQRQAFWVEQSCLSLVAASNFQGLRIDTFKAHDLGGKLDKIAAAKLKVLSPHGVTKEVIASPAKLSKLMFQDWGLKSLKTNYSKKKKDEAGHPVETLSTDKEVLHELSFTDPRAKQIREYREAVGNKVKFVDAPIKSVLYNEDGCSHPGARVFGTYTGRLTYSSKQGKGVNAKQTGWAIHQEKKDAEFRDIVIAPPGYTIVEADAAGQEFKWMAIASKDPTMLSLCEPGEDPHSYMTCQIYKSEDYREFMRKVEAEDKAAKKSRQMGKVGNLSLQYRTSPPKFRSVARVQYDIPMTMDEAKLIHKTYQRTYPRVVTYWAHQIVLTQHRGYAETFAGRRVQVVGNWNGNFGWNMGSTAINYPIQGTGAEQKYLALQVLKDYLPTRMGRFMLDLHDGIYMVFPDHLAMKAAAEIKIMLDDLPYGAAWNFLPPVPLTWDIKMGKSWGSLRGVKF